MHIYTLKFQLMLIECLTVNPLKTTESLPKSLRLARLSTTNISYTNSDSVTKWLQTKSYMYNFTQ